MNNSNFDDYLMRPMDANNIRIYYPFIGKKGRKGYKPIGDFSVDMSKQANLEERFEEITRKSEELIKKYLAEMN